MRESARGAAAIVLGALWLGALLTGCSSQGAAVSPAHATTSKKHKVPVSLATPGPTGPLNPRPGIGATKATLDAAWKRDQSPGTSCDLSNGCMYDVNGVRVGASFFGVHNSADGFDFHAVNNNYAAVWQVERQLLPASARLKMCRIIDPSDQGGPVKACIFSWENRDYVQAMYLDPHRTANKGGDGVVQLVSYGPFDDVEPGSGKYTITPVGPGQPTIVAQSSPADNPTLTPELAWMDNTAAVSKLLEKVDGDIYRATTAMQAGDWSTANAAMQQAQVDYQQAQQEWNIGPLPPPMFKKANDDMTSALQNYNQTVQDTSQSIQSQSTPEMEAAIVAYAKAKQDLQDATQAMLTGHQ